MGPIPKDFDLQPLVGLQFQQVCIDPCHAQYRLGHDRRIAGSGKVIAERDGGEIVVFGDDDGWVDPRPLTKLVGGNVTSWKIEGSHEFSITIDDSVKLRFISDGPYEDLVIPGGGWFKPLLQQTATERSAGRG